MSIDSGEANQLQRALAQSIREHWTLFLIEGIVLVVLGLLAIIIPPIATIAVTIFLGWLFLISGVVGLVTTFWARHAPGFWWSLLSAALAIAAGIVLLAWPVSGAVSLTLLLIVFFTIEGVVTIMYAEHRRAVGRGAGCWAASSTSSLQPSSWPGCPARPRGRSTARGHQHAVRRHALIAMAMHARRSEHPAGAEGRLERRHAQAYPLTAPADDRGRAIVRERSATARRR